MSAHLAAWSALAIGIVATGVGCHYAIIAARDEVRQSVARDADRIMVATASRVQFYEQVLMGAAALFTASEEVSREEWRRYVASQRIAERFPELQAIAFAANVRSANKADFIARVRGEGQAGFEIVPDVDRPIHTPIVFSEPEAPQGQSLIGLDLQADTTRWQTMTQAASANRPALNSGREIGTPSLDSPLRRLEFFVPAWRDQAVVGFAFAPLSVEQFIGAVATGAGDDLKLHLYDGILVPAESAMPGEVHESRAISLGGRLWTIDVVGKGRKAAAATRAMPYLVALAGSTISLLLFLTTRTFRRARDGERRFRDYAQLASDWLWELDRDMRFTYFLKTNGGTRTDVTQAVLGKRRRETAARRHDREELKALDRMEELLRAGHSFTGLEYPITRRQNEREYFRVSARPLLDAFGNIRGFRGVTQVVTAEKRHESELREAKAAAEAGSASKSRFLAMMSHELRTPLNAIIGFSEVIASQRFGPNAIARYADYAQTIHSSGQQLLELISQLLDMSKIEAGRLELEEEDMSAAHAIDECLTLLADRAQQSGVALTAHLPDPVPAIRADHRALRQVMLNLISNAIKFTSGGGWVEVSLKIDDQSRVVFRVRDNGIGIAPDALQKLFQPFQQADNSIARKFGGTGLGLAISRALVEAHGGTLILESEVGRGTTALVILPASRYAKEPVKADEAPPWRRAAG